MVAKQKQKKAKLKSNVIFGKSAENLMNKGDVKIVTTRKQNLKLVFRLTFEKEKKFVTKQQKQDNKSAE